MCPRVGGDGSQSRHRVRSRVKCDCRTAPPRTRYCRPFRAERCPGEVVVEGEDVRPVVVGPVSPWDTRRFSLIDAVEMSGSREESHVDRLGSSAARYRRCQLDPRRGGGRARCARRRAGFEPRVESRGTSDVSAEADVPQIRRFVTRIGGGVPRYLLLEGGRCGRPLVVREHNRHISHNPRCRVSHGEEKKETRSCNDRGDDAGSPSLNHTRPLSEGEFRAET